MRYYENKAIGIDFGIKTFAVLSNGEEIQNPKHLRSALKRLKKQQRRDIVTGKGFQ